jgi:outer membrane protein TolC
MMAVEDVTAFIAIRDTAIDVNPDLQYETLWQSTLSTNSSLLLAEKQTDVSKADYKRVMSRDYPYVRLKAGYGYTMNKYELSSIRQRDNWGLNAGVTVGFNLFDGKRRMQKRNARLAIEYAELERDELQLALKADLNDLWQAYRNNWQVLLMERQNLGSAVENYEYANLRYMKGDLSGFEMREAQQSLLDAEERLLVAEYDTKMCEISLLLLSGNVLDYLKE